MKNFSCAIVGCALATFTLVGCRGDRTAVNLDVETDSAAGTPPALQAPSSSGDLTPVSRQVPPPSMVRGQRVQMEPTAPIADKADETVVGSYKTDRGEILEVEGVCKMAEDSISCWHQDGSAYPELADRVKDSIEFQHRLGGTWNYGVAYGKKNRVVVFKWTHPMTTNGTNIGLLQVGDPNTGAFMSLSLRSVNKPADGVMYDTRMAATDPSAKTTSARLVLYMDIPERPRLEPKVGAQATFGGETYTITAIRKGASGKYYVPPTSGPSDLAWTISIKATQKTTPPISIYLNSLDAKDTAIRYVDGKGNPASQEAYREAQTAYNEKLSKGARPTSMPPLKYGMATMNIEPKPDGTMDVIVRVNPAKVKCFEIGGVRKKQIDLTGILLDPK